VASAQTVSSKRRSRRRTLEEEEEQNKGRKGIKEGKNAVNEAEH
jgi:hypothetical protein